MSVLLYCVRLFSSVASASGLALAFKAKRSEINLTCASWEKVLQDTNLPPTRRKKKNCNNNSLVPGLQAPLAKTLKA